MRVQAARPRGHRLPETIWKATMRPPPASSRYAATEIAERPAARPKRVPVRPPVPQRSPDSTRHRTPARGRCRAAVYAVMEKDMEDRSCDEKGREGSRKRGAPAAQRTKARQLTWLDARGLPPRSGARWRGYREDPVHNMHVNHGHAVPATGFHRREGRIRNKSVMSSRTG